MAENILQKCVVSDTLQTVANGEFMATDNPRIQVMLDNETNGLLANLALQQKRSVSATAAELIREALELHEDVLLSRHGDKRLAEAKKWIDHKDAWK